MKIFKVEKQGDEKPGSVECQKGDAYTAIVK